MDSTTPSSSCAMAVVATETVVGSHVLTIDGYTKTTAALAVGESIQSDTFRVGGYCWYIECYPSGQDEEGADWVSVFLYLDHHGGNHEVKASHKFVLLDRAGEAVLSARSRRVLTFSGDDGSWGIAKFIQRKPLESYLIIQGDDCCRIRCDVAVIKEPLSVPPPSSDLHRMNLGLGDLLLASEVGRDVTFVVGGEQFTAHSCVLAARSCTVFVEEVLGKGKESAVVGGDSRPIRVDGMAPTVFKALLHFIYTGSVPDEKADNGDRIAIARGLLAAADRYGMERLKMACGDMLCSYVDATTAVDTLQLAHKHGCLKLNQACVKFIRDMLECLQPGGDKLTALFFYSSLIYDLAFLPYI